MIHIMKKERQRRGSVTVKKWMIFFMAGIMVLLLAAGCTQPNTIPEQLPQDNEEQQENRVDLTLYYADREARYLVAELRGVKIAEGEKLEEVVLKELAKEPLTPDLVRLVPAEADVLGVSAENGIITVDFNENLRDNFYGGSSSEALLIYSIVNTLTELEGYEDHQVRFLINGQEFESIGGHMSAEDYYSRNETSIR
jgi:spore germination protein GerM